MYRLLFCTFISVLAQQLGVEKDGQAKLTGSISHRSRSVSVQVVTWTDSFAERPAKDVKLSTHSLTQSVSNGDASGAQKFADKSDK